MKNVFCLLTFILATTLLWAQPGTVGTVPPIASGVSTALPATCVVGQLYFLTSGTVGLNACNTTNTWSVVGGSSSLPTGLSFTVPTLTVSTAGSGNGALALSGNTSGTATFTAPAVAGTVTNPVLASNSLQIATGNVLNWNADTGLSRLGAASLAVGNGTAGDYSGGLTANTYSWSTTDYLYLPSSHRLSLTGNNVSAIYFDIRSATSGVPAINFGSSGTIGWDSATAASINKDTGLSRLGAASLAIGNGTASDTTGELTAAAHIVGGTTFTLSSNGCSAISLTGGATAGRVASGTTGVCAFTVLMGNTATAPNGWACYANDLTTHTDTVIQQSTDTTHASFSGTTVSGDVINFGCIGY